jgi:hypothetical protein
MKLLVIDDSLGNPKVVAQLIGDLCPHATVEVMLSPSGLHGCAEADLIILGGRWLDRARELREAFPLAHIIGRSPWSGVGPRAFFPWGNELRDPTLPLDRLLADYCPAKDRQQVAVNDAECS